MRELCLSGLNYFISSSYGVLRAQPNSGTLKKMSSKAPYALG